MMIDGDRPHLAACDIHGPMPPAAPTTLTELERRMGQWWKCQSCQTASLVPSDALVSWFGDRTAPASLSEHLMGSDDDAG